MKLFSPPTAPKNKFTKQDLISSLIRLGISLAMVTGIWFSTDLSQVLDVNEGIPYLAAVAYSVGNLIQAITREIETDQQSN
jgi:hypothetical protein